MDCPARALAGGIAGALAGVLAREVAGVIAGSFDAQIVSPHGGSLCAWRIEETAKCRPSNKSYRASKPWHGIRRWGSAASSQKVRTT